MILIAPQQPEYEQPETQWDDQVQGTAIDPQNPQFDEFGGSDQLTPWMVLNLIDPPPFLDNLLPAAGAIGVPESSDIRLDIIDPGAGVDASSVEIWVNGSLAFSGGAAQVGFLVSVVAISEGFRYTVDPLADLPLGDPSYVRVRARDLSDWQSQMDEVYQFQVTTDTAPAVTDRFPVPGSIGVNKDEVISFHITDAETDVELLTVRVWVRGVLAFDGVEFQAGWNESTITRIGSAGWAFVLVPDRTQYHRAGEQNSVRVYGEDQTAIPVDASWIFTAAEGLGLSIYRFILGSVRDLDEEQS